MGKFNITIFNLRLTTLRINLPTVTPLLEVTFPKHCTNDIQSAGRDDPLVSEDDFNARFVHVNPSVPCASIILRRA